MLKSTTPPVDYQASDPEKTAGPLAVFSIETKKPFPSPRTCIDWLEFTLFTEHTPAEILGLIDCAGMELEKQARGLLGYLDYYHAGPVKILAGGSPGMGTHVILSGGALRDLRLDSLGILQKLEEINGRNYTTPLDHLDKTDKLLALVNQIFDTGQAGIACRRVKLSRLDVALDDFAGRLNMPLFVDALQAGRIASRARRYGITEGGMIATGAVTSRTYYLGKRGSNCIARAYDKRQEQLDKGADPADLPEIWNRFELEIRDESAEKAAALLLIAGDNAGQVIRGIINNFAAVKLRTADTNKSRWPVATWWAAFVDTAGKIRIGKDIKKPDMPARRQWFERQCSTSAAMLAIGYGRDYLKRAVLSANSRLDDRRRADAENFAAERLAKQAPKIHKAAACPACGSGFFSPLDAIHSAHACEICGTVFHTVAGRPHFIQTERQTTWNRDC